MRFAIVVPIIASMMIFGLSGCGKIPTWGELTGEQKPTEPTPPPAPPTPPPAPPVMAKGPSPQEIIARFKASRPGDVSDAKILELTSLNEGLEEVTEINADHSGITQNAFQSIDKLTNLRQLRLNATHVGDDACTRIAQVPSLEVLTLVDTAVSDVGVAALSGLQNLKVLHLTRCKLSENGYAAIGKFPALQEINIDQTNLDNRMLDLVCNAKTLVSLELSKDHIDDYGLAALGKLSSLEHLTLAETAVTGAGLVAAQHKGGLKNLNYLNLYKCPLSSQGAKAVSNFKSLETLILGEIRALDDFHLKVIISGMKNLKNLDLVKCSNINGSGLQPLSGHKEIEEIHLSGCSLIGDPVVKILKTLKNLKKASLGGTAITPNAVMELRFALPELVVQ